MSKHKSDFKPSDNDWVCAESGCGNVNFARRSSCNRCGSEKKDKKTKKQGQEIGMAAAEKSKGLFSAEDWQCTKCGNVNWARRPTCNMCNAPKFTEVEERTGLGGGFNERGNVEYKEHVSDDEYDDFGRKKKKKGGDKPQQHQQQAEDDDDEDEEEEDDDGDLSKYDLWGADDSKEERNGSSGDKASKAKRSRSRSRTREKKRSRSSSSSSSGSRSRSRKRKSRGRSSSSSSSSSSSRSRSRSESRNKKSRRRSSSYSSRSRSRTRSRSRNRSRHRR